MAKRKIKWENGDVFAIPLLDGSYAIGHALDLMMPNIVRIALYDEKVKDITKIEIGDLCKDKDLISLVTSTREQLDFDVWKIIGNKPSQIPFSKYPCEQYRQKGWVGAKTYDAGLVEDFVNAFYSLSLWNDWANPNYLDGFLVNINKKPKTLMLKNR